MSFDDSNVMIRSEEETQRLKEERRKRMFGGAPSPSPISTDVSTVDTSVETTRIDEITSGMEFKKNVIYQVNYALIAEYPDNANIFSMDGIDEYAKDVSDLGFYGAIVCRYLKDINRLEIISGHRSFRVLRKNKEEYIPCIIANSMDDVETLTFLLKANINNRKWTPLDYARAIYAYTEKIQPHKSFVGRSRDDIADFFHISPTMVHRYTSILKMIPELQAMANDPDFPFSAFSTAATLTDDDQYILYNKINEFIQGNPGVSITRQNIEAIIKRIKNGTIDKEPLPKTVYLDDYVYKARIQLEKLQASDTAVKDKEQTLAYLHDLEKLIEEVKQKL